MAILHRPPDIHVARLIYRLEKRGYSGKVILGHMFATMAAAVDRWHSMTAPASNDCN